MEYIRTKPVQTMEYSKCIYTEHRSREYTNSKQYYLLLSKVQVEHNVINMQVRLSFHIQKTDTFTFDFASTLSTVKPFIASINLSNALSIEIKLIISCFTEEKKKIYQRKKENILN